MRLYDVSNFPLPFVHDAAGLLHHLHTCTGGLPQRTRLLPANINRRPFHRGLLGRNLRAQVVERVLRNQIVMQLREVQYTNICRDHFMLLNVLQYVKQQPCNFKCRDRSLCNGRAPNIFVGVINNMTLTYEMAS